MKNDTSGGGHFSSGELEAMAAVDREPELATIIRLSDHLSSLCPDCWRALDALPPLAGEVERTTSAVIGALRNLRRAPAALLQLGARHRASVAAARVSVGGFKWLLLEEYLLSNILHLGGLEPVEDAASDEQDPISDHPAAEQSDREGNDTKARGCSILALFYCLTFKPDVAAKLLAEASTYLQQGSGDAEVRIVFLEAQARLAAEKGDHESASASIAEARSLLGADQPADRHAELMATAALAFCGGDKALQAEGLAQAEAAFEVLNGMPAGTNPLLRLELVELMAQTKEGLSVAAFCHGKESARQRMREIVELLTAESELIEKWAPLARQVQLLLQRGLLMLVLDPGRGEADLHAAFSRLGNSESGESANERKATFAAACARHFFKWAVHSRDFNAVLTSDPELLGRIFDLPAAADFWQPIMDEAREAALKA